MSISKVGLRAESREETYSNAKMSYNSKPRMAHVRFIISCHCYIILFMFANRICWGACRGRMARWGARILHQLMRDCGVVGRG